MLNLDSFFMDPVIFKHPGKFNPDRFINGSGIFVKMKELIPLTAGRRMCIGEPLANTMLFLYVPNMLKTITFLPAAGGQYSGSCWNSGLTQYSKRFYSPMCQTKSLVNFPFKFL